MMNHWDMLFTLVLFFVFFSCQTVFALPQSIFSNNSPSLLSSSSSAVNAAAAATTKRELGIPRELIFNIGFNRDDVQDVSFGKNDKIWRVDLLMPITFLDRSITKLWVHINGFLLMDDPLSSKLISNYPLSEFQERSYIPLANLHADIIAILASENTQTNSGIVRARVINVFNGPSDELRCDHALQYIRLRDTIRNSFPQHKHFSLQSAIVINWEKLTQSSSTSGVNEYELILLSDGKVTFAVMHFISLSWLDDIDFTNPTWRFTLTGLTNLDGSASLYLPLPDNKSDLLKFLTDQSNVGVRGEWIFQIGGPKSKQFTYSNWSIENFKKNNQTAEKLIKSRDRITCIENLEGSRIAKLKAKDNKLYCHNLTCSNQSDCQMVLGKPCCQCKAGWSGNGTVCYKPDVPNFNLRGRIILNIRNETYKGEINMQRRISAEKLDVTATTIVLQNKNKRIANLLIHQLYPLYTGLNSLLSDETINEGIFNPFSLTGFHFEMNLQIESDKMGYFHVIVNSSGLCATKDGRFSHKSCRLFVSVSDSASAGVELPNKTHSNSWLKQPSDLETESKYLYDAKLLISSSSIIQFDGTDVFLKSKTGEIFDKITWNGWMRFPESCLVSKLISNRKNVLLQYYLLLSERKYCREDCSTPNRCNPYCLALPKLWNRKPEPCDFNSCSSGLVCENVDEKTHKCNCPPGSTEQPNGTCKVTDPQVSVLQENRNSDACDSHACYNGLQCRSNGNSAECFCPPDTMEMQNGFCIMKIQENEKESQLYTCQGCTGHNMFCDTTNGQCKCKPAFKMLQLGPDTQFCIPDCDACAKPGGVCDQDKGCKCIEPGFEGNGTHCSPIWKKPPELECQNVEYCNRGRGPELCLSGICQCQPGYQRQYDGQCIQEGQQPECSQDQDCESTFFCDNGKCVCPPGFKRMRNFCVRDCDMCDPVGAECTANGCICKWPTYIGNGTHCTFNEPDKPNQNIACNQDSECLINQRERCFDGKCQCETGWIRPADDQIRLQNDERNFIACIRNPDYTVHIEPSKMLNVKPGQQLVLRCKGPKYGDDLTPYWDLSDRPELKNIVKTRTEEDNNDAILSIEFMLREYVGHIRCRAGKHQANIDDVIFVTMSADPCFQKCQTNAYCNHDQRECQCLPNYFDNGIQGCELMGCSLDPRLCHPNAFCVNNECRCSNGYIGNGLNCTPEFDCRSPNPAFSCGANADCRPSENGGPYKCKCRPNYIGDGRNCYNSMHQCNQFMQKCPTGMVCHNVDNVGRICACPKNLVGNFHQGCHQKINCNDVIPPCGDNAQCVSESIEDVITSVIHMNGRCVCIPGYFMFNGSCVDEILKKSFILAALSTVIYRIPMIPPPKYDIFQNMWHIHPVGDTINHISTDCFTQKVFWTMNNLPGIYWMSTNVTNSTENVPMELLTEDSGLSKTMVSAMTVDSASGNIFIAERQQIILFNQKTKIWRRLMINIERNYTGINALTLDDSGSVLFWAAKSKRSISTILYTVLSSGSTGKSETFELKTLKKPVLGLTFDENTRSLCWSSGRVNIRYRRAVDRFINSQSPDDNTDLVCEPITLSLDADEKLTVSFSSMMNNNNPSTSSKTNVTIDPRISRSMAVLRDKMYLPMRYKRAVAEVSRKTGALKAIEIQPPCCGQQVNAVAIQSPCPTGGKSNPCDEINKYGGCRFLCVPKYGEKRECFCPEDQPNCKNLFAFL